MATRSHNRICFTIDELLMLLWFGNRQLFTHELTDEDQATIAELALLSRRSPRRIDPQYIEKVTNMAGSAPVVIKWGFNGVTNGNGSPIVRPTEPTRIDTTREVVDYATSRPSARRTADRWEETGEELATFGTVIAKIPALAWLGEPLEFIGGLTAMASKFAGDIVEIWK